MCRRAVPLPAVTAGLLLTIATACSDAGRSPTSILPPDRPHANILGVTLEVFDPDAPSLQALAISDAGVVVGYAYPDISGPQQAFRWSAADGMRILGTVGGTSSAATGVNELGHVVGWSLAADGIMHAFLWTPDGGIRDLRNVRASASFANDINDDGVIVGYAGSTAARWVPVSGTSGFTLHNLGTLQGGQTSVAHAINNAGAVVGFSQAGQGARRPFLWTPTGGMQELVRLSGYGSCEAVDINASNHAVGFCTAGSIQRAVLWTSPTSVRDLGTLGGAVAQAVAINDAGQVMGTTRTASNEFVVFLWTESDGMENVTAAGGETRVEDVNNHLQYVGGRKIGEVDFEPNVAPVALEGNATTIAGTPVAITLAGTDVHHDPLTYQLVTQPANGTLTGTAPTLTYTPAAGFEGTDHFSFTVRDPKGLVSAAATFTITVLPSNRPPVASAGGPYAGDEGAAITLSLGGTDPDGDALTFTWDLGDGTTGSGSTPPAQHRYADNGSYTITLTADDGRGGTDTETAAVTVTNVAPTLGALTAPVTPTAVGGAVAVQASFTDPGVHDTHVATIQWGDGSTSAGTIATSGGVHAVTASHAYTDAGVYTVQMTVVDKDGGASNTSVFQYVVVYDPAAGFVTGGGWILSPADACQIVALCGSTAAGKATFGFVSRYQKGASVPTGNTQFQYHAGGFNFRSTSYEWLVISGAKAQYKGSGSINGSGDYGFLITATDGHLRGDGIDRFRLKVWDRTTGAVIYDNNLGAADDLSADPQAIGGGSIQVQSK